MWAIVLFLRNGSALLFFFRESAERSISLVRLDNYSTNIDNYTANIDKVVKVVGYSTYVPSKASAEICSMKCCSMKYCSIGLPSNVCFRSNSNVCFRSKLLPILLASFQIPSKCFSKVSKDLKEKVAVSLLRRHSEND